MSHPYAAHNNHAHSRHRAKELARAEGGTVVKIPFREGETSRAIERLSNAGEIGGKGSVSNERARDFLASQARDRGLDPQAVIGREPKYKKGGSVK